MKQFLFLDAGSLEQKKKYLVGEQSKKEQKIKHYQVVKKEKEEKKEPGDYFQIEFSDNILKKQPSSIQKEVEKVLATFLKKYHKDERILVVGLGNSNILADSLGCQVTNQMIATNQYNDFLTIPKVALFNPEVTERTGISSFKLIKLVVEEMKPDVIIMIDSLATKEKEKLNRVIEISDTGIIPGSALRCNKEINRKTFHIPILSIGVPLVYSMEKEIYTSVYLERELSLLSKIIAESLNHIILF